MKKLWVVLICLFISTDIYAQSGGAGVKVSSEAQHPLRHNASRILPGDLDLGDYTLTASGVTVTGEGDNELPDLIVSTSFNAPHGLTLPTTADNGDIYIKEGMASGQQVHVYASGVWVQQNQVSDVAYGATWDNDITFAPTKNAVYDKIQTISGGSESTTVADTATLDMTLTGTEVKGDVITLKDLVTTAPLTGGTNDILVGAEADITLALTTGIANTNAVVINAADVAVSDYAKFTASGLEGRSYSEVLGDIGAQAADADLTTYAGITPSANAQTLLASTFAQMQASLSIDDLITLSGVAEGSVNLATFTGSTISDNVTIKAALQALETSVETKDSVITAGRSLTRTTNDIAADAETYAYKGKYGAYDPVATDDTSAIDYFILPVTITEFRCFSDQTVVVQLQRNDGTAANMFTADVTCDSGGGSACSSGCDTTLVAAEDNMAATDKIDLVTVSVSGTPTEVTMHWFGTYDD